MGAYICTSKIASNLIICEKLHRNFCSHKRSVRGYFYGVFISFFNNLGLVMSAYSKMTTFCRIDPKFNNLRLSGNEWSLATLMVLWGGQILNLSIFGCLKGF